MEFITSTFKKDKEQPPLDSGGLVYLLLSAILFLLAYLLFEFDFKGWASISAFAAIVSMYFMRYHNWGKKEAISGYLDKELKITLEEIQIGNLIIDISSIEKLAIELDKYENQNVYYIDVIRKSDGNSNRITITTNEETYTEFFRIGTKTHFTGLYRVIDKLKEKGTEIELINWI